MRIQDIVALGKPRLSFLVLFTTGVGLWMAPTHLPVWRAWLTMFASALVVGAANALNCFLERDSDKMMRRTRLRPLPAGRLEPSVALYVGLGVALFAVSLLAWAANILTAALSAAAFIIYVCIYTPMKRRSWLAVVVGAVPGAIPPLMGAVAATGRIDAIGLVLFAILFFWQLPHFFAIAIYLKDDYARGGIVVLPLIASERVVKIAMFVSTLVLLPVTLLPWRIGIAGQVYASVALSIGAAFLAITVMGFWQRNIGRWSRLVFTSSLGYLTVLLVALVMGAR